MLKPEYYIYKADRMIEIYAGLESWLIQDIARRLFENRETTATTERELQLLHMMGMFRNEARKKISHASTLGTLELREILRESVIHSWRDERPILERLGITDRNPLQNRRVREIMDAVYHQTRGELDNISRTTMSAAEHDLRQMLDEAVVRTASGAQSYDAAVCEILDQYAQTGIMVEYPETGARRSLEAAVRCCVVTGMAQVTSKISLEYVREAGENLVLVSAHPGARVGRPGAPPYADHSSWQGKVYSIKDSDWSELLPGLS